MDSVKYRTALIVGAGEGLSAALARLFAREGIRVALAARQTDKLGALSKETGATAYTCDATSLDDVTRLFASVERDCGAPDVVVYNAGLRVPGAFLDLIPADAPVNRMAPCPLESMRRDACCATKKPPNALTAIAFATSAGIRSKNAPGTRKPAL